MPTNAELRAQRKTRHLGTLAGLAQPDFTALFSNKNQYLGRENTHKGIKLPTKCIFKNRETTMQWSPKRAVEKLQEEE